MSLIHAAKVAFDSLVSEPHPPAPRLSGLEALPPARQVLPSGFLLGAATAFGHRRIEAAADEVVEVEPPRGDVGW